MNIWKRYIPYKYLAVDIGSAFDYNKVERALYC